MTVAKSKKHSLSLFIFRRDLRLDDNTGLIQAVQESKNVIPCFIFDPRQVGDQNKYGSSNCIQFMIDSLQDLDEQLHKHDGKLYIFYGQAQDIIKKLLKSTNIEAVYYNRDYTPFSIKRDEEIAHICQADNIEFIQTGDALLNEPEDVLTLNRTPYAVFTAFYKNASKYHPVKEPQKLKGASFYTKKLALQEPASLYKKLLPSHNKQIASTGGRKEALKILKHVATFKDYTKERDIPALDATTHLSAHLKFGTVSVRECYHAIARALGNNHPLLRQLYWRDFFTHVAYNSPFVFGHAYHKKYDDLWWENDKKKFAAWCQGKTGFPIVDAGMRQLNATGFMHNRVRMIVASFLVKDLHIDWRWGEKYFAQQLVDYDPAVNNGNWQWAASTGCDAQPYFRIFNPWLQQKKFDPECEYIKKWVSELKTLAPKIIHSLFKDNSPTVKNYPKPICDHGKEAVIAKKAYRAC